ncbi:hypothetical protein [Hydrogenophaga sp.]|uniref:hypothetical protein n=1 Tax=Hydrogenophaga sp. TaxID=1904254 RepID=UPI00271DD207|nr:hypothetical protein [Hydrogenophaga sp.]MDO9434709.1 hypothetical protein [Hydrogenophaga sp.]
MKGVPASHTIAGAAPARDGSSKVEPETADERVSRWNSKLPFTFRLDAAAQQVLNHLANGFAPPDDAQKAQDVFNTLIANEAFDVFVEVFAGYNAVRAAHARGPDDPPFKSLLTLKLPGGWKPDRPADFISALAKVQVDRLEVVHPEKDAGFLQRGLAASVRSFFTAETVSDFDADRSADVPVPAAVCEGICALLGGGTKELMVRGALASPEQVADAISFSDLRRIELGEVSRDVAGHVDADRAWEIGPGKMASYEKLMSGLAKCKTLTHLSFTQRELVRLHPLLDAFHPESSNLTSVTVTGQKREKLEVNPQTREEIKLFMEGVARFQKLTDVSLEINFRTQFDLVTTVFQPLIQHRSLKNLEILATDTRLSKSDGIGVFREVIRLARATAGLEAFKLEAHPLNANAGGNMAAHLEKEPLLDTDADVEEFLANPTLNLRDLSLINIPIPPKLMSAVSESLATNKTLRNLNLSGCYLNIQTVVNLSGILESNGTLFTCQLPDNPGFYFIVSKDGRIHGMALKRDGEVELRMAQSTIDNPEARASARSAFNEVKDFVASAPRKPQSILNDKRTRAVNNALKSQVLDLLQLATPPHLKSQSDAFREIAKKITPRLGSDAKEIRELVHLTEVAKAMDADKLHAGGKTPEEVKKGVKVFNAWAVRERKPGAPLMVNTVDPQHVNQAVQSAVKANNPKMVRKLMKGGALNFGGRNDRDVTSLKVQKALRKPVKNTTVTTPDKETPTKG